ncbi:imelysin family protein [Photobacterium sp. GB-210]|uniref:imelysin family protein n=1 Tax=Photobacterium sp. GB-210 TaxID=2022104 RepID=UPI000D16CA01|nr:imelysin family protein [Photobacterium sp. GB-210]PSV40996.1 iron-regulated protein A [Photobacterium sp. GB-210]
MKKYTSQSQIILTVCTVALSIMTTGCSDDSTDDSTDVSQSEPKSTPLIENVKPTETLGFNLTPVYELSLDAATKYQQSTRLLHASVNHICTQYSDASVKAAQEAWLTTMQNWMALQGREKGSEEALALSWQVQFWPDKKNTTGRKLKQLLQSEKTFSSQDIADQSVVVQGLGAAEWFLFQEQKQLSQANYCQLADAITGHMVQTASALVSEWKHNPWQTLPPPLALGEYLGALNNQLDYTLKKLTRPMGKPGKPKPYQAEAWRSQTSMVSLKASVEALHQLYLANGKGLHALLINEGHEITANRINQRFELLLADWPQEKSMGALLKTKAGYRELINVFNGLEYIQLALHDDVAAELGIVMGFNATDGD